MPTTRREFLKYGIAGAIGVAAATAVELPILNNQIQQENDQIKQKDSQIQQLEGELATAQQGQGFLTLNPDERTVVEAIAETIIPSDATGPGAKEAGVIYFIDRILAGNYGKAGNMYMQGPFILPTPNNPVTVGNTTYPGGTISPRLQAGTAYQYPFTPREFWRRGLMFLQDYCNSAYGGKFETLSSANQTKVLQDLFDNTPTNFTGPTPAEFFNELHDMVTAGFWTDPLYGGNQGMVGWNLLAFPGSNMGMAQGLKITDLMVANAPTRLPPISLSDLQKAGGGV